jgi:hypothetical protein
LKTLYIFIIKKRLQYYIMPVTEDYDVFAYRVKHGVWEKNTSGEEFCDNLNQFRVLAKEVLQELETKSKLSKIKRLQRKLDINVGDIVTCKSGGCQIYCLIKKINKTSYAVDDVEIKGDDYVSIPRVNKKHRGSLGFSRKIELYRR